MCYDYMYMYFLCIKSVTSINTRLELPPDIHHRGYDHLRAASQQRMLSVLGPLLLVHVLCSGRPAVMGRSSAPPSLSTVDASVDATKERASSSTPFTELELDSAVRSLELAGGGSSSVDLAAYRELLRTAAHTSHKDWPRTEAAAQALASILGTPDSAASFRQTFGRVLSDGNWEGAASAAVDRETRPWIVLVTGVNGIRKTSSVHQPWFQRVLAQALGDSYTGSLGELPDGGNSFFRQLDYMIATVACDDFRSLYALDDVTTYANFKDGIFSRYRKVAETLGVLLIRAAESKGMNVMVETSGRDVAMYEYIDYLFPGTSYNKLVVHFTIDEISFAETSVEKRMLGEMSRGKAALGADTAALIGANAGGPYGPAVLRRIEAESNAVWEQINRGEETKAGKQAGKGWLKVNPPPPPPVLPALSALP